MDVSEKRVRANNVRPWLQFSCEAWTNN